MACSGLAGADVTQLLLQQPELPLPHGGSGMLHMDEVQNASCSP